MATKKKTPRDWYQDIVSARKEHFTEDRVRQMDKAMQFYRTGSADATFQNRFLSEMIDELGAQGMKINMVGAIVENFVSQIVPAEVKASSMPKRPGDVKKAENVQLLFNNDVIPNTNLNYWFDCAAQQAAITGDAFLKIGYVSNAKRGSVLDEDTARTTNPDYPDLVGGGFDVEDESQYRGESLWFQVIHSNNLVPSPGALSIHDADWISHRIRRLEDVAKSDVNYSKKARDKLRPITCSPTDGSGPNEYKHTAWTSAPEDVEEGRYVDVLEIFDYRNKQFYVISPGNLDDFLYEGDWPFPALEGYPITHLYFKRDPQSFFGIPMIQDITDLQEELNTVSAFMVESYKRSVPFTIVDENSVDDPAMQMLADALHEQFVRIPLGGQGAEKAFFRWPPSGHSFSPDVYGVRNMIMQAMMLITGMTDFMMGQSQKTKSATETAATIQGFTSRMRYKSKLFRWFLRDTLRKSYQILRTEMGADTEKWVRTVGADGFEMIPVTAEDLRAELDIDIDAEIFDDRTGDPVRQKLILDAMAPILQAPQLALLTQMDLSEIMRRYLKAIGEIDIDKIMPAKAKPKDPMMENMLMATGQEVNTHPIDDDMSHIDIHIQFQQAQEPGSGPFMLAEQHVKAHAEMLQVKQQLAQQRDQDLLGAALGGGNGSEAPSRRSTPNAGEQNARTQQVING
jgi:hypothetical protein